MYIQINTLNFCCVVNSFNVTSYFFFVWSHFSLCKMYPACFTAVTFYNYYWLQVEPIRRVATAFAATSRCQLGLRHIYQTKCRFSWLFHLLIWNKISEFFSGNVLKIRLTFLLKNFDLKHILEYLTYETNLPNSLVCKAPHYVPRVLFFGTQFSSCIA